MKTVVKEVLEAVTQQSMEKAQDALKSAIQVIDKIAGKGIIHRNTASRRISRLTRKVNSLAANVQ
jgi:small subunit ribosomal protein S20